MKISLKDLIVDRKDDNTIYMYYHSFHFDRTGPDVHEEYAEPVNIKTIPYDNGLYLIPATFTDESGNGLKGFTTYQPLYNTLFGRDFTINADGTLSALVDGGLLNMDDKISIEMLVVSDAYDQSIEEDSASLPNRVEWNNFFAGSAYVNVAYAFEAIKKVPIDIDLDFLQKDRKLLNSNNVLDEKELAGYCRSSFLLHKVFIENLPEVGLLVYLPVEIDFNSDQRREGYALFNVEKQEVMDIHIYDKNNGQISAMFDNSGLEDCGIFKDEEQFDYKILLSNIL